MGLFGKKTEGGLMDVIRCDEQEYLVWKWRPFGEVNLSKKENSIRYGSSLRVKDGELAVFVYQQKDFLLQDFIIGPFDQSIKTDNFPILSSIVGTAFGGSSPFQAEIYFINLSGNVQIKFGIPFFNVFDPRFSDISVPVAARGTITFNLTDYKAFIKLNRLINFELDDFKNQIKDIVTKYVKGVITNIPSDKGMPVLQMERKLLEINELISSYLKLRLEKDFGINMKALDISAIEIDKESVGFAELRRLTIELTTKATEAQNNVSIKNMQDMQAINALNMEETLHVQREEAQRYQKLQTETNFMGAHALNQQTEVLKTGAESLGSMGNMNLGDGGMSPAGMMTGMMMGGAMGNQMAGMMNTMGLNMNQQQNTPPPTPTNSYNVSVNGQTAGPFNFLQLQQMFQNGQLTQNTLVWKQGMTNWDIAVNIEELSNLFNSMPPPPPPSL